MATTTLTPVDSARWAHLPPVQREEIDVYETELRRFQAGQMSEKVFLEFRLRYGTYGQRQDRVQMQRIKIPMGRLTTEQMIRLADVAEEYAAGVLHVTTRQDFQIHFVDINDCPNIFRRLAEVGITTREACGNTVRNVTCCPQAGICGQETFDVTPHAWAMAYFMLRHPDTQNFGRKFKIAFSGCADNACGLARLHDIGAVAAVREVEGRREEGFQVFVGGGLGSLPQQAFLFSEFTPVDKMLPLAQAIGRVFALYGEKKNRGKARLKFLINKLGLDEFKRRVQEELERLTYDPAWEAQLEKGRAAIVDEPLKPPSELSLPDAPDPELLRWLDANVRPQKQPGYSMVEIFLPLGDISPEQMRRLALLCRKYIKETVRTTVPQNLLLRWVSNVDLPALYVELKALQLADVGAGRMRDVCACPGTDSCKLGIASSRGLAADLHRRFNNGLGELGDRSDLSIKISGCFNSCGQHHIADIGMFGSVQRKGQHSAPVFQVVLGGTTEGNARSYGLTVSKVPAKNAPAAVERLAKFYDAEKQPGESFSAMVERVGKARLKQELEDLAALPNFEEDADFFRDARQSWFYEKSVGVGECAGAVVDQAEFLLEDADRLNFEATLELERHEARGAAEKAFQAQLKAAQALLFTKGLWLSENFNPVEEFRTRFYDTDIFLKPFAENFFRTAEEGPDVSLDAARQRVEETTLFIEAAQSVYSQS